MNSLEAVQRTNELAEACADLQASVKRAALEKVEAHRVFRDMFLVVFAPDEPKDPSQTLRAFRAARERQQKTEQDYWELSRRLSELNEKFEASVEDTFKVLAVGAGLKTFHFDEELPRRGSGEG
jgi:hypothetical protein